MTMHTRQLQQYTTTTIQITIHNNTQLQQYNTPDNYNNTQQLQQYTTTIHNYNNTQQYTTTTIHVGVNFIFIFTLLVCA